MLKPTLIVLALLCAGSAYADEVIINRDAPDAAPPPATSTTTVEKHGRDCDSRSVRTESETGESKTVTQTDCD